MNAFRDVFREERFYCNHFFRLLCERLSDRPAESGLRRVLDLVGIDFAEQHLEAAEVFAEVAAFRDIFFAHIDKDGFLERLFDRFVPIIEVQYAGLASPSLRPSELKKKIGAVHPVMYGDLVKEPEYDRGDVLFYREFGALFNAKPDFLLLLPKHAIWIEAKCNSAFSGAQIQRMRNIAVLCEAPELQSYFGHSRASIVLLGSAKRHQKAQGIAGTTFLSWEQVSVLAANVFAAGPADISSAALARMAG